MINYYLLTKPGIVFGNLVTFAAGFLLATNGNIKVSLFFITLVGLAFIIASACAFNNYIDINIDKKMERTKDRALVKGIISGTNALLFASALAILGAAILYTFTNILTLTVAGIGFFVYVFPYSLWKSRTIYGTAIGSVAGAIPPVVGYCAVSNHFDLGAFILFVMLVLWQMPHFFAIAMYHVKDYTAAKIPVLPLVKGAFQAKIHMVLYIIGFVVSAILLTYYGYTGYIYLYATITVGLFWLMLSLQGFRRSDDTLWGKQMFQVSLVMINVVSFTIFLDAFSF